MKLRTFVLAVIMLVCAVQAYAQTPVVAPNTPIRVAWDYDVPTGTSFSILVDGTIVKNFSSADLTVTALPNLTGWSYEATMPGVAPGKGRKIKLRAHLGDPTGIFAESNELIVDVAPTTPGNFRIILTPTNGGVEVELRGAPIDGATPKALTVLKFPTIEK